MEVTKKFRLRRRNGRVEIRCERYRYVGIECRNRMRRWASVNRASSYGERERLSASQRIGAGSRDVQ